MRERTKIPPTIIYTGWWKFRPEAGPYLSSLLVENLHPNGPYLWWKISKAKWPISVVENLHLAEWPISEFTFSSLPQCIALKLGPNLNLSSLVEKLHRLHAEWPISQFSFFTLSSLQRFHRKSNSKSQRLLSNRLLGGSMAGLTLKDFHWKSHRLVGASTGWPIYPSCASFTFSWLGV